MAEQKKMKVVLLRHTLSPEEAIALGAKLCYSKSSISDLQEKTSIVITTNKGFEEWTEFLGDAALATAILDRLSFQCDKIQMNGKSYRLENRKSFLDDNEGRK